MCGLFGFSGKDSPEAYKIHMLGIFNESRGTDSCGIFLEDKVYKGAYQNKVYRDFIKNNKLQMPTSNFAIIGHTRNNSVGVANEANAHPFSYNLNKKLSSVFAHNGTLKNWRPLVSTYNTYDGNSYDVDSDALGHLVINGHTSILKSYEGAATCLWHHLEEKNTIYAWKGASTELEKKNNEGARPLHGLKTKNGMYICSEAEPLEFIAEEGDELICFEVNKIIKIVEGEIVEQKPIDRWISKNTVSSNHNYGQGAYGYLNGGYEEIDEKSFDLLSNSKRAGFYNFVYWMNGRYYKNLKLLEGPKRLNEKGAFHENGKNYFFVRGVMIDVENLDMKESRIRSKLDKLFNEASKVKDLKQLHEIRNEIAKFTKDPFDFLINETKKITDYNFYTRRDYIAPNHLSGEFYPLFNRKIKVKFNNGSIESIIRLNKNIEEQNLDYLKSLSIDYWLKFDLNSLDWNIITGTEKINFFSDLYSDMYDIQKMEEESKEDKDYWNKFDFENRDYSKISKLMKEYYYSKSGQLDNDDKKIVFLQNHGWCVVVDNDEKNDKITVSTVVGSNIRTSYSNVLEEISVGDWIFIKDVREAVLVEKIKHTNIDISHKNKLITNVSFNTIISNKEDDDEIIQEMENYEMTNSDKSIEESFNKLIEGLEKHLEDLGKTDDSEYKDLITSRLEDMISIGKEEITWH